MSEASPRPNPPKPKPLRRHPPHGVKTKCAAVLSIWSERRKPAEVCRELGINWPTLNGWQNQAMEGMLQALEPRQERPPTPAELNPLIAQRLQRNLARRAAKQTRLQRRLNGLLEPPAGKTPKDKSPAKGGTARSTPSQTGP